MSAVSRADNNERINAYILRTRERERQGTGGKRGEGRRDGVRRHVKS